MSKIHKELSVLFNKHNLIFQEKFITKLTQRFNSDTLTNKMEINKLDDFLTNNQYVSQETILELVSNNTVIIFDKVVECCTNGNASDALSYFQNIYENPSTSIALIRMFTNHFKLIEKILIQVKFDNSLNNVIENLRPPIFFKKRIYNLSM